MSNTENWVVANRDSWDVLYQESVAYYWNSSDKSGPGNQDLFSIYEAMGVSNIRKDEEREGDVLFLSETGEEIVRVHPVFSGDKGDSYISGDAYKPKNGWSELTSEMRVKIPNRVLLSNVVRDAIEAIDFDKLEEITKKSLGKEPSELFKYIDGSCSTSVREHILSSFESSGVDGFSIARIPALLTFVGLLDSVIYHYQDVCANVDSSIVDLFGSIESNVYRPLTGLLSSYVSLGLFFPFGFNMLVNVGRVQEETVTALRSNINASLVTHVPNAEDVDFTALISGLHNYYSQKDFVRASLAQEDDRGGIEGFNDDYAWEQFVPRLVAYNWASMRSTSRASRKEILEEDELLNDCTVMLENLGYKIPDATRIAVSLVDELPFTIDKGDDGSLNVDWNFKPFISELSVIYPTAPSLDVRPMALGDLIARRANEPFTSF